MIVLYFLVGLIVLILLVAALVGTAWSFEKSIIIQATADKVWDNLKSLAAINRWNPWMAKDPNIRLTYSGTDGEPGASFSWTSNNKNVGEGSQTILKITEKAELLSRVDFIKPFRGTGNATLRIGQAEGATKVSWKMDSSTPYPMNIIKIFGLIEKNMEKDFGEGLGKLKTICEQ
jgi:hypothetical protein